MDKKQFTTLVRQAQKGDTAAMNTLLEHCYQDLYHFAYQTVKNPDLAADIAQESCIDILNHLGQLHSPGAFGVWARQITYHQCTRHFRQTKEYQAVENEDGESILDILPDENPGSLPEQVVEDKEFQKTMQDLLDSLPAEQRAAMMLYYYEKLSVKQIAEIFETSEGTIKSRLNYGRKAMKTKVEDYEKKNGIRLHSSLLPLLLLWMFRTGRESLTKAFNPSLAGIVTSTTGAAGVAASAGATAGTAGAAAAGAGLTTKIVAGVVAAALAAGSVIGGMALFGGDENRPSRNRKSGHVHSFSATRYDQDSHWSICDCGEANTPAAHSFAGGSCTNCDYVTASNGLEFMRVEGGYAVVGLGSCTDTCISIPSTYLGEPVVAIQPVHTELIEDYWDEGRHLILYEATTGPFEGNKKIESVFIPGSVTYIGVDAFAECTSLSNVVLEEGVEVLDEYAFYGCTSLEEIVIPSSTKKLEYSFMSSGLVKATVSPGITDLSCAFYGCEKLTDVTIPDTVTIMDHTFSECKSLTQAPISRGVTSLNGTFSCCDSLTDVVLPEGITTLYSTFFGCDSLTSVVLSEGVTNIDWAFSNCTSLTNVILPKGITSMEYAFSDCTALTDIILPEGITNMLNAFSDCTALVNIVVPDGATNLVFAFIGCTSLTSVTVPESATDLDGFIQGCSSLTDIYYKGTMEQWNVFEMYRMVGVTTGDFVVHCTDGDISGF